MNKRMSVFLFSLVFLAGVGAALWVSLNRIPPTVDRQTPMSEIAEPMATKNKGATDNRIDSLLERVGSLEVAVDDLTAELRQEQAGKLELQRKISSAIETISAIEEKDTGGSQALTVEQAHDQLLTATQAATDQRGRFDRSTPNVENLEAAGIDTGTAESILQRLDDYALADLELRDQASREGWLDSEDFDSRRAETLPERVDLRTELGDDGWDRYLYASGRSNRVGVESIISGSAASSADMLSGDVILRYAGKRIFTISELQAATREGQRGEVVSARLGRGGTLLDIDLPRGPLGVSLSGLRVPPTGVGN